MTPHDRSKWARMVSVMLSKGGSEEYAKAQLEEYGGGLTTEQINRAVLEGSQSWAVAQFMTEGKELAAEPILQEQTDAGAVARHVLVRFTVRRGKEDEIRSATVDVFGAADPELIRDAAERAVDSAFAANLHGDTNLPTGGDVLVPNSIQYTYVAPLFRSG